MSTESIASSALPAGVSDSCAACGAPLADDQRYCLQCGERRWPMSSVLLGGAPAASSSTPAPAGSVRQAAPPAAPGAADGASRSSPVTMIAGVGVLLLAMGVGVLIGRAGAPRQSAAPAQVITVAGPSGGTAAATPAEASFTSDWPSGTSGYTIRLQTLPQAGTSVSAVEAAKSSATAKGAKAVGALESNEFSSLKSGNYLIYDGVYTHKAQAQKALTSVKKSFPGASVIAVNNRSSGGSEGASEGGSSSGAAGSSESHPAPPTVLKGLTRAKGKSYEERSKNLPDVIETG